MQKYNFNTNNFDLIRLFAAMQVALHHSMWHLNIEHSEWYIADILKLFPGVPIFFFISGFLISKSYEKNSVILQYAQNRALRLFPGLIACGIVSVIVITLSGYLFRVDIGWWEFIIWVLSQITTFQFYDPDFLSGYGIGQANGSLWTVFIEIQFYILVPLIYLLFNYIGRTKTRLNILLTTAIIVFLLIHLFYYSYHNNKDAAGVEIKLLGMSFAPYFYMFLIGVFFQKNFDIAYKYLSGRFLYVVTFYILVYLSFGSVVRLSLGNNINPLLYLILCCVVFSFAFTYREFSNSVLKRNDISYGVYIYHMPVVNLFIYTGFIESSLCLVLALMITVLIAIASWVFVERPSMTLKSHPLNPLAKFQ